MQNTKDGKMHLQQDSTVAF